MVFLFALTFSCFSITLLQNNTIDIKPEEQIGQLKIDPLIIKEGELNPTENFRVIVVLNNINKDYTSFLQDYTDKIDIIMSHEFISSITLEATYPTILQISKEAYVEFIWLDKEAKLIDSADDTIINDEIALSSSSDIGSENGTGGYNGSNVIVAVLDTGVDPFHPDLGNISQFTSIGLEEIFLNINYTQLKELKIIGHVNFADLNPYPIDINGHGTYVAGIIAGTNGTGVAPGAYLFNVKVLTDLGIGYWSWIISGIEWSISHGADIITLAFDTQSWDLPGLPSDPLNLAINEAVKCGIVVIAAAGDYPSSYLSIGSPGMALGAITVGAYNNISGIPSIWENSSRGPTLDFFVKPDILAPGINITSTTTTLLNLPINFSSYLNFSTYGLDLGNNYSIANGSAGSTAYVAGAVALLIEQNQYLDPNSIKIILHETADSLCQDNFNCQGAGMINLTRAQDYLRDNNMIANLSTQRVFTPFLPYDGFIQSSNSERNLSLFISNYGSNILLSNTTTTPEMNTTHLLMGFYAIEYNDTLTWFLEGKVLREFHNLNYDEEYSSGLGILEVGPFYIIIKAEGWNDTNGYRNTLTIINKENNNYSVTLHSFWHTDLFLNGQKDNDSTYIESNDVITLNDTYNGENLFFGINSTNQSIANNALNKSYFESKENPLMSSFINMTLGMSWNLTPNKLLSENDKTSINITMSFDNSTLNLINSIDNITAKTGFSNSGDIAVLKVENVFRTKTTGELISTECLVMNVGDITLDNIDSALIIHRERNDDEFMTINLRHLYSMKPGEFEWVNFSWVPLEASSYEMFWVAGSQDALTEYFLTTDFLEEYLNMSRTLENESYVLDNFFTRNVFINNGSKPTYMPLNIIFPLKMPFNPFLIKFPTDFSLVNFSFFSNHPISNISFTLESDNKSIIQNYITLPEAFNLTSFDTRPITIMIPTFPI